MTKESTTDSVRATLGFLALQGGFVLLMFRSVHAVQPLTFMPRFWYNHQVLWWYLGLAGIAAGVFLLGRSSATIQGIHWRPTRSGRRFRSLVLYTRAGCHLCDEARQTLAEHGRWLPNLVEVDIDHDPRLTERYGTCVPVVSLDGKVRFRGKVSVELLRRLIEGTPPGDA